MITIVAAIAIASEIQGTVAGSGTQSPPQSLLQQLVPQPTGRNGYEEYLMACDIVRSTQVGGITDATPEQFKSIIREFEAPLPQGMTEGDLVGTKLERPSRQSYNLAKKYENFTVLQLRREAVNLAGRALDLVHRGNQKPVFDPRAKTDITTLFPEYTMMRGLGRLAVAGAYVAFAEGRSKQATQYLCDAIILGQNLTDGVLVARLVGIAIQATTFAAFERFLPNMSMIDAQMVEVLGPKLITSPPAAVHALNREFAFINQSLESMFDSADSIIDNVASGNDEKTVAEQSAHDYFSKMTPTEKKQLIDLCKRNLARHHEQVLAGFRRPEANWDESVEDTNSEFPESRRIGSVNDLAEYLSNSVTPVFSQLGTAEIRNRTQIRLLTLAGSVIRFRWENDRWPTKLSEAVGEKGVFDPASNDEFQYEVQGTGFRVYSKGSKTTGEIALRYRRQPSGGDNQPPPPSLMNRTNDESVRV